MSRRPRFARVALLVAAMGVAVAAPTHAQSRIRTGVDTTLVTVGDRITLTVSVEHAPEARVVWPDSLTLAPFEVIEATVLPARPAGDAIVSSVSLSLAAFALGALEIPPFEVAVVREGEEPEILETDRFGIEVVTVGTDETGDIREIRGPLGIPVSPYGFLLLVLLVLLPALLAYVLYRRFRPRGDARAPARGPPPRPAHELALAALAALEASPLLQRGQVKEYHIEVSEIIRTYIERRFRVDALEMTSSELLSALERAGVDGDFLSGLRRFLDQCDLVKFAKVRPEDARARAVLALGRDLVDSSIPAVMTPDVDVGEGSAPGSAGGGGGATADEPGTARDEREVAGDDLATMGAEGEAEPLPTEAK